MNPQPEQHKRNLVIAVMSILAIWLVLLFAGVSWFQQGFIKQFTQDQPEFLNAEFSQVWLQKLSAILPPKTHKHRIIQFWQPNCLCNRFARPHAIQATFLAQQNQVEHITLISDTYLAEKANLQALNPDTQVISISPNTLQHWPVSPSVVLEHDILGLTYIGPLGFGAFCSQASTSIIEQQIIALDNPTTKPFYNVIGKGCFCPWK